MKIFILENVEQLTYRYHSDGGLVIIAKDLEKAKELIKQDENIKPTEKEWELASVYELKDNDIEEKYFVFPDAGCC